MIRLFVFTAILSAASFAQTFTIEPNTIPGIELIGPQSPDYSAAVAAVVGSDQPRDFLAWIPYGVVIRNTTAQAIVAFTLKWSCQSSPTEPLRNCSTYMQNSFTNPHNQLQPAHSLVALPNARSVFGADDLRAFTSGGGMGNLPGYQQAQAIDVALDAIVFASGQFVGPNATNAYDEYELEITTPRTIATTILDMRSTQSISAIVAWLQTVAQKRSSGLSDGSVSLSRSTARRLLNLYNNHGEAALYSDAEKTLDRPAVRLHR